MKQKTFYINYMEIRQLPQQLEKDGPRLIVKWSYKLMIPVNFFIEIHPCNDGTFMAKLVNKSNELIKVAPYIMRLHPIDAEDVIDGFPLKEKDTDNLKPDIMYKGRDILHYRSSAVIVFYLLINEKVCVKFFSTTLTTSDQD